MNKPLKKHRLKNLMINELSLVTRPANQGSHIILTKSDTAAPKAKTFSDCLAGIHKQHGVYTPPSTRPKNVPPLRQQVVPGTAIAKLPNHNAVSIAKAEVAGKLNDYVEKWQLPSESSGQT